ncbi:MAG: lysophospholipid acyltransferase family protein [Myxococcota bacterium]
MSPDPVNTDDPVLGGARRALKGLSRYHRHRVYGLEHIPAQGPAIVAVNHSLVTYDVALLSLAHFERTGRLMRGLGDRSLFQTPFVREAAGRLGAIDADPAGALELLRQGEVVIVAPGGMREALRTKDERYRVFWDERRGFARLAIQAGCPVILGACPRADDVLTSYRNPFTPAIYKRLKLPVPLARGLGPTLVPRPIALTHILRPPVAPPADLADLHAFHRALVVEMHELMHEARNRTW